MSDTGYKLLKKTSMFNFLKWGEYMKRAQIAERKLDKLKKLVLLVDPAVSSIEVNSTAVIQWNEFIKEFPDEAKSC